MSDDAMAQPFVKELVNQVRAHDTFGAWGKKTDAEVISPYIVDKEARKALPMMANPDPDTIWRVEMFYNAVALTIERRSGLVAQPIMKMHHEGFGRVVLTVGRLVAVSKHLRDVHRFGFVDHAKLNEAGEKLVAEAVDLLERFPEAARA
ncbi:MAG: NifX-associated nitrogen fixation protein [Alphaproteobacteria bacterium]|nr:NifX-associated nitrogen fixation protein [Alphaproteobacteria bacterium]